MQRITRVADSLLVIEAEMRRLSVWSTERPSTSALQSSQPFCVDTLEFTEWLQFIFLPRMKMMIERNQSLPAVSGIAPMAEEYFRGSRQSVKGLIQELETLDRLLSQ